MMTRDGGTGNLTCTAILLGLLGLPWSDLTEKAWNQTLIYLRLPGLKIGDKQHTPLHLIVFEVTWPSKLRSNYNRSFSDLSLRCDSLSRCWFCIRCHFPIGIFFKLGKAGWYCVTKGSSFLRANLFLCWGAVFLSTNLREVLSHNYSGRVASFYQAIFEISDILLNIGLRRILKSSEALALLL